MSEWGIALIAAGSAILGSITTGFFAWKAGHRQAGAAEAAGRAQAGALISTVQATLDEQRRARTLDQQRQAYLQFVTATDNVIIFVQTRPENRGPGGEDGVRGTMLTALTQVELEGPESVFRAADLLVDEFLATDLATDGVTHELRAARAAFMDAARHALSL
ncbi:hypothetical protein [Streptomyces sp. NPDC056169]|uniref:hypothetical protein n=1 Tax=Streptomyces sp. NPDC056169 TaxID=3345734 RepID=UPI0035DE8520